MHVLGAERVDSHTCHQGRVDATRQADDHVGESVLAYVVARAQHERLVQLLVQLGRFGHAHRQWLGFHRAVFADEHHPHLVVGAAATRVEQTLAVDGLDDHVGHQQFLDEHRRPGDQIAVGVEHHAAAVEHQLVLTAHLVHVRQRTTGVGRTSGQHALAGTPLAEVVRRAVDVDVQFGAARRLLGKRTGGAPDVFADADAHLHAADDVQLVRVARVAGCEVAGLVEHGVVGQQALAIRADHMPVHAHSGSVVEVAVGGHIPHHCGTTPRVRGHLLQGGEVVGHETRLHHQVLGRVAGDGELGERHQVAPGGFGAVVRLDDLGHVAGEVTDHGVDLGQSDAQPCHG